MNATPSKILGVRAGITARSVSPARRRLLEILQSLNFGRVEQLEVRSCEPVLDPLPSQIREHKFAGENGPRPEAKLMDFVLKEQQLDLLRLLDDIRNGTILVLTCKHGLPFSAEVPA
jgi:hypothetical protein